METKITESTSPKYNGPTEKITIDYRVSEHMKRIADALEEILRLVKKDQEESKKRWEKETIGE